jgi:hypothetical protein
VQPRGVLMRFRGMYVYTVLGILGMSDVGVYPTWPMSGTVVATRARAGAHWKD